MRHFVRIASLASLVSLASLGSCGPKHSDTGVLPQRDAALGCAEQMAGDAGFQLAPRDNTLGATVQADRREFLKWSPAGNWYDANEIQRIAAWIVMRHDTVGLRTEAYVMRKPSSQWTTAPEDTRTLATRIQSSCTGQTSSP
jgi:hypothetical protein